MAPRVKHCCDHKRYENYYLNQAGNGISGFQGTRYQRGAGLGSMFTGLMRHVGPLLKQGAASLGKYFVDKAIDKVENYAIQTKRPAKTRINKRAKRRDIFK